jgi:hypothetical protein
MSTNLIKVYKKTIKTKLNKEENIWVDVLMGLEDVALAVVLVLVLVLAAVALTATTVVVVAEGVAASTDSDPAVAVIETGAVNSTKH